MIKWSKGTRAEIGMRTESAFTSSPAFALHHNQFPGSCTSRMSISLEMHESSFKLELKG